MHLLGANAHFKALILWVLVVKPHFWPDIDWTVSGFLCTIATTVYVYLQSASNAHSKSNFTLHSSQAVLNSQQISPKANLYLHLAA